MLARREYTHVADRIDRTVTESGESTVTDQDRDAETASAVGLFRVG